MSGKTVYDSRGRQTNVSRNTADSSYHAIAIATEHPTNLHPYRTVFNSRSFNALANASVELDVVSPTPYAPPFGPYSGYKHVPKTERWESYITHHPRFLYALPKRLFYHISGDSLAKRVTPYVNQTFEVPDVIHAADIYLDGYGMIPFCRQHDLPLFVTAHGGTLRTYNRVNKPTQDRIRETLQYCEKVLCVSRPVANRARKLTDPSKVTILPLGADPDKFPTGCESRLRMELGIDPDTPVILFIGRYVREKGTEELISAMQTINIPDAHLICIGQTGDQRWRLIRELGKTPYQVDVLGGQPPLAVRRWLTIADLLLLPSHEEGRPTVIYEAMASRTCVLATSVGGIPEQVVDGETGVLIPPKDPDALAKRLTELLSDLDRTHRMGKRGYERLLEKGWTWKHHAERLRELHRAAIR